MRVVILGGFSELSMSTRLLFGYNPVWPLQLVPVCCDLDFGTAARLRDYEEIPIKSEGVRSG